MRDLTRFDYMYIIIIILLVASLIWVFLPFVYSTYNGNIDSSDCITDTESVRCYQYNNFKECEYNCTRMNGTIEKRRMGAGS